MAKQKAVQYFRTSASREQYIGKRYFRYDYQNEICVQVCCAMGEIQRRGKANILGVYLINKVTFFSNYLGPGYVQVCTQKEFEKNFEEIVNVLR